MFQQILSARFLEQAYQQAQCKFHRSVYSPLVVMWLLIRQRLDGAARWKPPY